MSDPRNTALDEAVVQLTAEYLPIAKQLLADVIRIPADYVDRPEKQGGDASCGLSNHEKPRLELLKERIVEIGAVDDESRVFFDEFGNLVWEVDDPNDGIAPDEKAVIFLDGHSDTVKALRARWTEAIGDGVDAYDGRRDQGSVNKEFLKSELGYLPPENEWENLIFGRGSADQLGGVVCQALATKIARELRDQGALKGVIVRAYATVAEEDNDGGGPMYVMRQELPGKAAASVPDVVILSEGTGCSKNGAVGIYRGQRGRMQIEVRVTGKSCHGSMPWEGKNPLEHGGAILAEAAKQYDDREGFLDDAFLGHGTRTASWATLDSPSDCAVPERFVFRFDRRLTVGETPDDAVSAIEKLATVKKARENGLTVEVSVPTYDEPTWKGYTPGNAQVYPGWVTPEDHPAIRAAVEAYSRVASPQVEKDGAEGARRKNPRVDRWVFSTDGVGYPVPTEQHGLNVPPAKNWVRSGSFTHPAMFGIGPGIEQNTHKIGECVDAREMALAIAVMARFPSIYVETR